jgi:hypothetical protein
VGAQEASPVQDEPPAARFTVDVSRLLPELAGNWSYLCGAVGSAIIFVLLFQPWLATKGWDGKAESNAFGHITATTVYLNLYSQDAPKWALISGVWAILASVVAVVNVIAALGLLRSRAKIFAQVAVASSAALAVLVMIELIYLDSKGPDLKKLVGFGGDLGAQIGLAIRGLLRGYYPWPGTMDPYANSHLTATAMTALVISLVSAAAVMIQFGRDHGFTGLRQRLLAVRPAIERPEPAEPSEP